MDIDLNDPRQLEALKKALNELGAADPEEGARLHAEKNAPWINGQYSHLKFPPYVYRAYPKVMYHPDFLEARAALDRAVSLPVWGSNTAERDMAVRHAEAAILPLCKNVGSEPEEAEYASRFWRPTPTAAKAAKEDMDRAIAQAAAEAAYDDRHLGELAKRERAAADEESEGHLVEIPEAPRKRRAPAGAGV